MNAPDPSVAPSEPTNNAAPAAESDNTPSSDSRGNGGRIRLALMGLLALVVMFGTFRSATSDAEPEAIDLGETAAARLDASDEIDLGGDALEIIDADDTELELDADDDIDVLVIGDGDGDGRADDGIGGDGLDVLIIGDGDGRTNGGDGDIDVVVIGDGNGDGDGSLIVIGDGDGDDSLQVEGDDSENLVDDGDIVDDNDDSGDETLVGSEELAGEGVIPITDDTAAVCVHPEGATPVVAVTDPAFYTDDFANGRAEWQSLSGEWAVTDGAYVQSDTGGYDRITEFALELPGPASVSVDLLALEGPLGGGFILAQPEAGTRNGATVVDFTEGGRFIRWGSYVEDTGVYAYRGGVAMPDTFDPAEPHQLSVELSEDRTIVRVDGSEVGRFDPLPAGQVGLITSVSSIAFDNFTITELDK